MAKKVVKLFISELKADLENGLPWYKSENEGDGSIEEKYEAERADIEAIRQHPKLKGLEPAVFTEFQLIDDTEAVPTKESAPAIVIIDDEPAVVPTALAAVVTDDDMFLGDEAESAPADFENML
jgi:hypothetical protein